MVTVVKKNGKRVKFDSAKIENHINRYCSQEDIQKEAFNNIVTNIYDGIETKDLDNIAIFSSSSLIEKSPNFDELTCKFFLQKMRKEVFGFSTKFENYEKEYKNSFITAIKKGVDAKIYTEKLLEVDLEYLADNLKIERDFYFKYIGLQTLYERYLLKINNKLEELPQSFWMRVAMGLAINETNKEERILEFYEVMSQFQYVPSTPTLFHSGHINPQLASCFLLYVNDDLKDIFKHYGDIAQLSKFSGGIGSSWGSIRSTGSYINTTRVESQGIIPFIKIVNDITVAIARSGKRRGAQQVSCDVYHYDIEDFIDLKRNVGDTRRRAEDLNTAVWIPDLFIKRVKENGEWTLFSPDETPDLTEIYGKKFEERYAYYESLAKNGGLKLSKTVKAKDLWRKLVTSYYETGHPWFGYKDAANVRNPQDHCGVIHNTNLCCEILENNSKEETAVCNLGSLNLSAFFQENKINYPLLKQVITTATRMLDNVIDINWYPVPEAQTSNMRHRPIGLGKMGWQDLLYKLDMDFESDATLELADQLEEFISYNCILASSDLAKEKGSYSSFKGSKWDRGIFPLDTLDLYEQERGDKVNVNRESRLNWTYLKEYVKNNGLRNSLTLAAAPTATISTIIGCFPTFEPAYKNLYSKSNMSGQFVILNEYLVQDLKKIGLWTQDILDKIKYYNGSVQNIEEIPEKLKRKYKEAFEISQFKLMDLTAVRGKWVDQSQSHNMFCTAIKGSEISDLLMYSYEKGLKTLYYMRTMAKSQIEKATLSYEKFGRTQTRMCKIDNPECESCQ